MLTVFILVIPLCGIGECAATLDRTLCPGDVNNPKEKKGRWPSSMLTKEEASFLRTVIYKEGFDTTMREDLPLPQRQVALKKEVIAIHKKKRVSTIALLLDIVKGARPTDARAAGVTGLALEQGPAYAVLWGDGSLDSFDEPAVDGRTDREKLAEQLEKSLATALKQLKN